MPTTDVPYRQYHVRVVVDSQQASAVSTGIKPRRTPKSEREEKQSSSTKKGRTRDVAPSLTIGLVPQGKLEGGLTWTNEETIGSEKKQYTSRITQQEVDGVVWWGFNIDDPNEQEDGIDMPDDILPAVHFKFVGDSEIRAPPPERMDIVIASYWSIIPQSEPKSTWIHKLLHLMKSSGNTQQAISYSNLFQIVSLETVPSNLPEESHYKAGMQVWPGATDPQHTYLVDVKRPTASSINVKPAFIQGMYISMLTCQLGSDDQNIFR